jgi:hypothetical protein
MFFYNFRISAAVLQRTRPMLGVPKFTVNDFFARRTMIPIESIGDPNNSRRAPPVTRPAAGLVHMSPLRGIHG